MKLESRKKKRENFMCDLSICFSVGGSHGVGSAPMFLVTGDNAIKAAATTAQCPERILTLQEYLLSIGLK